MENWIMVYKNTNVYEGYIKESWGIINPKSFGEPTIFNVNTRVLELPDNLISMTNDPNDVSVKNWYDIGTGEIFILEIGDYKDKNYKLLNLRSAYAER